MKSLLSFFVKTKDLSNDPEYLKIIDLPGFLSFDAFKLFKELAQVTLGNKNLRRLPVLEIGIYCGRSLLGLMLIYKHKKIIGVDPFYQSFARSPAKPFEAKYLDSHAKSLNGEERFRVLIKKITALGLLSNVEIRRETQEKFLQELSLQKYQFVYVDGEHSYQALNNFLNHADTILTKNSILVVDDLLSFGYPGISEAVHRHKSFRRNLFPICYAFNKGVFIYKPSKLFYLTAILKLKKFVKRNKYNFYRADNDSALVILER